MKTKAQTGKKPMVIGVGEVLWDLLPAGRQLGGAPANFACHAQSLGAEALVVSCVGDDLGGRDILTGLRGLGLRTDGIAIHPSAPTGTVSVALDGHGQPTYTIHENVAWDFIEASESALGQTSRAEAICFGSLAQRNEISRAAICQLLAATPARALRVFDINLRQHYYSQPVIEASLALANVLKVNDAELPRMAEMLGLSGDTCEQISRLAERFELQLVACTRGSHGSLLYSGGMWSEHPGHETKVADTVGAGDAFTAAMTLGFLAGWDLNAVNEHANAVAAYVCSQRGATPALPETLRALFNFKF